jgi:TonB family protein
MTAHVQQASMLSGRSMTFVAVIGLHALVISALMMMKMMPDIAEKVPNPLQWFVDPPPVDSLPPQLATSDPKVTVPIPTALIINPPDITTSPFEVVQTGEGATTAVVQDTGAAASGSGASTVIESPPRVITALQYRITRATDEYYPDTSRVLQEQGVAVVRVCADAAGRMSGAPVVEASSGSKRLDQAALRWARESLSFTAATENGVGVPACKGFRVKFNLN